MDKWNKLCKHENYLVVQKEETYPVMGENTTIVASVKICTDCGKEIFDFKLDEENLQKAFRKYKRNHALMTPEEIVDLRKKYNISQRTLATLIGCSQATVVRYESGNIQNNTHNNIMRMLQKPENMADMLEIKEEELSEKEITSIRNALDGMKTLDPTMPDVISNFSDYMYIAPNQFSGFREFDFGKYIEMIRFFAERIGGNLYKTKLFKLLWYSDMHYFKEYTKSMSGMNYVHFQYGPVPREYSLLLGLMERMGAITIADVESKYGTGEVIIAKDDYEDSKLLASDEIEILEKVLEEYGQLSAGEISERSHKEKGYMETANMELISYKYAMDI